ncbi:hypothetical protein PoB_001802000 [Plakobranchus ocellatus]|uniref:Uncharacterized protein n=1 Tax=Plakobranchus ocellatus TaxID=259542 RepID=A0AAV3Z8N5_9GAST|nr:hypothetical protein PoB_001802000 [Plakobranchus ocellatus]
MGKKTQVIDVNQYIQRQKWRWAGHIAGEKDNRWTIKDAQSGIQGQEEETGVDQKQDGWMTSEEQQVLSSRERHKIGGIRKHLQRATSCSGWTKPLSNQVTK